MVSVPGLYLFDFLTEEQEKDIASMIDSETWKSNRTKSRKIQIYGPYHDFRWKIIPGRYTPHPKYSLKVANLIREHFKSRPVLSEVVDLNTLNKICNEKKCEIFVNEYLPRNGLKAHHDHRTTYDETIFGVSLLSDTYITFIGKGKRIRVKIPRRSLYVMTGESRYTYKHSIRKSDIESRRLSMTYRTIAD